MPSCVTSFAQGEVAGTALWTMAGAFLLALAGAFAAGSWTTASMLHGLALAIAKHSEDGQANRLVVVLLLR